MKWMTKQRKTKIDPDKAWIKVKKEFDKGNLLKAVELYDDYEEVILSKEEKDSKARTAFLVFRELQKSENADYYDRAVGGSA